MEIRPEINLSRRRLTPFQRLVMGVVARIVASAEGWRAKTLVDSPKRGVCLIPTASQVIACTSKSMRILAIDPGLTGAMALLDEDGAWVMDLPVEETERGKNVDILQLISEINLANPDVLVIEDVWVRPTDGRASAAKFIRAATLCDAAAMVVAVPTCHIRPQVWKKHHGLIKAEKDDSRLLAIRHFPLLQNDLARKKDHNRAEALLIAQWFQDCGNARPES